MVLARAAEQLSLIDSANARKDVNSTVVPDTRLQMAHQGRQKEADLEDLEEEARPAYPNVRNSAVQFIDSPADASTGNTSWWSRRDQW